MFTKIKKVLGSVFPGVLLALTFGLYTNTKAEVKVAPATQTSQAEVATERELLDQIKADVKADYRANIARFESSSHSGKGNA